MSTKNVVRYLTVKLEISVPEGMDVDEEVLPELNYEFDFDNAEGCEIVYTEIVDAKEHFE